MNDSRQYRFPYLIRSLDEFPEDFPRFTDQTLFPALFLPRDGRDLFGRSVHPPSVVLMTSETLEVHFHPESRRDPASLTLDEYLSVQTGRLLLIGWIGFASKEVDVKLPYNRRTVEPIRSFLGMLRARVLRSDGVSSGYQTFLGDALDPKFQNTLSREIDKGEIERVRMFSAPRMHSSGYWLFRINSWTPGNLIALTDRRLLWITERYRRTREQYGSVTCYAHVSNIAQVDTSSANSALRLLISLRNGRTWKLDIPKKLEADAREFAAIAAALTAIPIGRAMLGAHPDRHVD